MAVGGCQLGGWGAAGDPALLWRIKMLKQLNVMDLVVIIESLRAGLLIQNPYQSYRKEAVETVLEKLFQAMQDIDISIIKEF
jgi:hypothetical protein